VSDDLVRLTVVPNETEAVLVRQLLATDGIESMHRMLDFAAGAWDGWAVAGPGPWTIQGGGSILAGHGEAPPLPDGAAVRIATGARIPPSRRGCGPQPCRAVPAGRRSPAAHP